MKRDRNVKIVATLGPASDDYKMIRALHGEDLEVGQAFRLDLDDAPGTKDRVQLPHKEIFDALEPGAHLLVNDGKIKLRVKDCGRDFADCEVLVAGTISNRKGVNVPDVVLPLAALSEKDRKDLEFVCELGVDWLALSFVQRPADVEEARKLAKGRAALMSKIEKPTAVTSFDDILAVAPKCPTSPPRFMRAPMVSCCPQNPPPVISRSKP